jgi:hypothetical protein
MQHDEGNELTYTRNTSTNGASHTSLGHRPRHTPSFSSSPEGATQAFTPSQINAPRTIHLIKIVLHSGAPLL